MFRMRLVALGLLTVLLLDSGPNLRAQQGKWEELKARVEELFQKGDYAAAIPVAKEDLRVAEATFGATDPNVATALNNLGLLYEKQSQFSDAEPLLQRALIIRAKALGPDDPQVARSMSMLAQVLEAEAKYDDAEELYERAYVIDKKALGLDNPDVAAIANLMNAKGWKTNLYTRDAALKVVVQRAESPVVVHLATHGFFLPDQQNKITRGGAAQNPSAALEDPMLRSGLYFAGADRTLAGNLTAVGSDNGILTAMEAANLNLGGTELVVLSACNTGQGDVKAGEGVFGLRRALQEAGARAVLMSMWSVPDKETTELMQHFYIKWLAGTDMHEALKQAQLEIREEVKREHSGKDLPYYWGAFVLVGR
jgi:CHAT domain-containing protein